MDAADTPTADMPSMVAIPAISMMPVGRVAVLRKLGGRVVWNQGGIFNRGIGAGRGSKWGSDCSGGPQRDPKSRESKHPSQK
jgi:hypothetical protein